MNLHSWLTVVFLVLALASCAQMSAGQDPAPAWPYSRDSGPDMRGGSDGGGEGGGGM